MRAILTVIALSFVANTALASPRTPRSTHREQVAAAALLDRLEVARGELAHRIATADEAEVVRLEATEDELSAVYWKLSRALDGAWGLCDGECPTPEVFRATVRTSKRRIEDLLKRAS